MSRLFLATLSSHFFLIFLLAELTLLYGETEKVRISALSSFSLAKRSWAAGAFLQWLIAICCYFQFFFHSAWMGGWGWDGGAGGGVQGFLVVESTVCLQSYFSVLHAGLLDKADLYVTVLLILWPHSLYLKPFLLYWSRYPTAMSGAGLFLALCFLLFDSFPKGLGFVSLKSCFRNCICDMIFIVPFDDVLWRPLW